MDPGRSAAAAAEEGDTAAKPAISAQGSDTPPCAPAPRGDEPVPDGPCSEAGVDTGAAVEMQLDTSPGASGQLGEGAPVGDVLARLERESTGEYMEAPANLFTTETIQKMLRYHRHPRHSHMKEDSVMHPLITAAMRAHEAKVEEMQFIKQILTSPACVIVCMVVLWMSSGMIFYVFQSGFTAAQAFYFATQAGLSIGFGLEGVTCDYAAPGDEDPTFQTRSACRWFTLLYSLFGSSFIAVGLSLYVQKAVEDHEEWKIVKSEEVRKCRVSNLPDGLSGSKSSTPILQWHPDDITAEAGLTSSNSTSWVKNFILSHRGEIGITVMAILWLLIGTVFAMVEMDFDFTKALYFAFSALSTGGLEAPADKTGSLWFTGWFCLTGVPVYVVFLGIMAGSIAKKMQQKELQDSLRQQLDEQDATFQYYMANVVRNIEQKDVTKSKTVVSEDQEIQWADYLVIKMMKRGRITPAEFHDFRKRFDALDLDNNHLLSLTDITVSNLFDRYDYNHDGSLELGDFARLCADLQMFTRNPKFLEAVQTPSDVLTLFNLMDKGPDGTEENGKVAASTFFEWWSGKTRVQKSHLTHAVERHTTERHAVKDICGDKHGAKTNEISSSLKDDAKLHLIRQLHHLAKNPSANDVHVRVTVV